MNGLLAVSGFSGSFPPSIPYVPEFALLGKYILLYILLYARAEPPVRWLQTFPFKAGSSRCLEAGRTSLGVFSAW